MSIAKRLDELLRSKYSDYRTKLYFLTDLFELAQYWNFSKENRSFLKEHQDIDELDFYIEQLEYYESEYLQEWENLNSLENFIELKELLKQNYFDDTLEPEIKYSIVNAISAFPTIEDMDFYDKVIYEVFKYNDIDIGTKLLVDCYKAIRFLESNTFHLNILKVNDEKIKLFYGNSCIINCNYSYSTYLKATSFFLKKEVAFNFVNKYHSKHSIEMLENKDSEVILNYMLLNDLDNPKAILSLQINNDVVIKTLELNIYQFLKDFYSFTINYFNKQNFFFLNINVKIKEEIILETTWEEENNKYITSLIVKEHVFKIDTRDVIFIFSSFLCYLTLIYELKYSLCLQKQSTLSEKDYMKLISLFEKAI